MSRTRQPIATGLTAADEPHLTVRTLVTTCPEGLVTRSYTERWHRLVASTGASVLVTPPGGAWACPPGTAVWIPAEVPHGLEVGRGGRVRILFIRPDPTDDHEPTPTASRAVDFGPLLEALVDRVVTLGHLDDRRKTDEALRITLRHEIVRSSRAPRALVWPADERAVIVARRIIESPGRRSSLVDLCRGCGASPRTIQRRFADETGLTFEAWRSRARHLHAVRLLGEGIPIAEVARRCGYRSASAFTAAFRRTTGTTPGRQVRGQATQSRRPDGSRR